jgi:hypothetical protein
LVAIITESPIIRVMKSIRFRRGILTHFWLGTLRMHAYKFPFPLSLQRIHLIGEVHLSMQTMKRVKVHEGYSLLIGSRWVTTQVQREKTPSRAEMPLVCMREGLT